MLTRPMDREKRRHDRAPGLEVVEIELTGRDDRLIGVIRDRSSLGARIQVGDPGNLPTKIKVFSPSIGQGVDAQVRWQRGKNIGVRFSKRLR